MAQTQCFAIYRNNSVAVETLKAAALIEYADQLPGNRRLDLAGRQRLALSEDAHPAALPLRGLNAPAFPHMTGRAGGSLCLACLREADLHSPYFGQPCTKPTEPCWTEQDPATTCTESLEYRGNHKV